MEGKYVVGTETGVCARSQHGASTGAQLVLTSDVEGAMPSVYELHLRCLALNERRRKARPRRSGRTRRAEAVQKASAERSARLKEILQEVRADRRKWAS